MAKRIAAKHIGFPDEETMSETEGLVENHFYQDLRAYTLEDYPRMVAFENSILEYEGDLDEDEASEHFQEEDNEVFMLGLDAGVASTVIALAAIGACPLTSCSGQEGHYETHPLVVTWADEERLKLILQAAERVKGVQVKGASTPGIIIFVKEDLALMRKFADALVELASRAGGSVSG